jgi:hypothetical protein
VEGFARADEAKRQSTQTIGGEATRGVLVSHTDHTHVTCQVGPSTTSSRDDPSATAAASPRTRTNTLASVRLLGPHYGRCAPVLARTRPFDQAPAAGGLNGTGVPMADHRAGRYVSHRRFGIGDLAQALVRLQCKLFCAPKN